MWLLQVGSIMTSLLSEALQRIASVSVLHWQKHRLSYVSVHVFLNGRFFFFPSEKLFRQVQQGPSCMTQRS